MLAANIYCDQPGARQGSKCRVVQVIASRGVCLRLFATVNVAATLVVVVDDRRDGTAHGNRTG